RQSQSAARGCARDHQYHPRHQEDLRHLWRQAAVLARRLAESGQASASGAPGLMQDTGMSNGPSLTPIDEALAQLLSSLDTVAGTETVALADGLNRVVVNDQTSAIDVPGFAVSAMDGYAVAAADLLAGQRHFAVSQRIPAGHVGSPLAAGSVARIFTGAPMPPGADAVIMQENVRVDGDTIEVLQSVAAGENVRPAGDDVRHGSLLVEAGQRLRAPDIGMLAGSGIAAIEVRKPLRVAILTTGDELLRPGKPLQPG